MDLPLLSPAQGLLDLELRAGEVAEKLSLTETGEKRIIYNTTGLKVEVLRAQRFFPGTWIILSGKSVRKIDFSKTKRAIIRTNESGSEVIIVQEEPKKKLIWRIDLLTEGRLVYEAKPFKQIETKDGDSEATGCRCIIL